MTSPKKKIEAGRCVAAELDIMTTTIGELADWTESLINDYGVPRGTPFTTRLMPADNYSSDRPKNAFLLVVEHRKETGMPDKADAR